MVERVLGKDEVTGSIPVNGSTFPVHNPDRRELKYGKGKI